MARNFVKMEIRTINENAHVLTITWKWLLWGEEEEKHTFATRHECIMKFVEIRSYERYSIFGLDGKKVKNLDD